MEKSFIELTLYFCANIKKRSKMQSYKGIQIKLDMIGWTSKH